jgi:hypothetical protein
VIDDPERVSTIVLAAPIARDFERLLVEYAELMGAEPEECRAGAETMVGEAGVRAFNDAVMANRKLSERMGWR